MARDDDEDERVDNERGLAKSMVRDDDSKNLEDSSEPNRVLCAIRS